MSPLEFVMNAPDKRIRNPFRSVQEFLHPRDPPLRIVPSGTSLPKKYEKKEGRYLYSEN